MNKNNKYVNKLVKCIMEDKHASAKYILTKLVLEHTAKRIQAEHKKLLSK